MPRSPVLRILLPLLGVVIASVVASVVLPHTHAMQQATALPGRSPRLVSQLQSEYELHRSLPGGGFYIYALLDNRYLIASELSGKEMWRFDTGDRDCTGYCVTYTGEPYIVSPGGQLYSVDASGKLRWKKYVFTSAEYAYQQGKSRDEKNAPSISAPLCDFGGNVYLLLRDRVVAYKPDGAQKYVCPLSAPPGSSFMDNTVVGWQVADDGTAFVATDEQGRPADDGLRIIDVDGKLRKQAPLVGRAHVDPHNSLIIDEQFPGKWVAYDYDWNKLWELPVNSRFIDFDDYGTAFAATFDGSVVAVSPAGKLLWTTWLKADEVCAGGDYPVYAMLRGEARIVALDKMTGKQLWDTGPSAEQQAAALHSQYAFGDKYFLTYLYTDCNGAVYFEGTGSWLFVTDEH